MPTADAKNAETPPTSHLDVEPKDVVRRFAERGEEALHRLADLPGGAKALKAVSDLSRRVDELGRKVRGVDELERRLERLELEVAELRGERPLRSRRARADGA
ncbi:MAG: hypothetical protein FJW96_17050 [Actinobacteria bacterium]|nr:hypothetical protein [Actinomycetota bacterium]